MRSPRPARWPCARRSHWKRVRCSGPRFTACRRSITFWCCRPTMWCATVGRGVSSARTWASCTPSNWASVRHRSRLRAMPTLARGSWPKQRARPCRSSSITGSAGSPAAACRYSNCRSTMHVACSGPSVPAGSITRSICNWSQRCASSAQAPGPACSQPCWVLSLPRCTG